MPDDSRLLRESAAARAARITAHVEKLEWDRLFTRLTRWAYVCTRRRSYELAEEIAQTALTQVLDPFYVEWDPEREPDLFDHLCNVARGIISNRRRKRALAREVAIDAEALEDMPIAGDANPERELSSRQEANTLADKLGTAFANDTLVTKIVALAVDGVTTPREQAEATGAPIEDVRNARKRLFRAAADVARELGLRQKNDDAA